MSLVLIAAAVQLRFAAAMETSKLSALLLLCMLSISSLPPILACGTCPPGKTPPKIPVHPPVVIKPPPLLPPVVPIIPPLLPPVVPILPPVVPIIPPLLPPVVPILPPVVPIIPPLLPPVVPILPPVVPILPPTIRPPKVTPPKTNYCPPPPAPVETCPVDVVKFGFCVDLLGGLVNVKAGDPAAQHCCPLISGLAETEAALCLCTTLKLKLLNLKIYVPIALQLLVVCGKTPPPGYTCKA